MNGDIYTIPVKEIKHNLNQLVNDRKHRTGSHNEQPLLFSLVYLILCYTLS